MLCVRTRSRVGAGGSHHDVGMGNRREISGCASASSKTVVVLVLLQ